MIVDHFIMVSGICICGLLLSILFYDFIGSGSEREISPAMGGIIGVLFVCIVSLYFNKDLINGRSPAKRILKLQVIDKSTARPATPIKCLVRNFTLIIWPVEVIVVCFNPAQRLGDRLAGTKVVEYQNFEEKETIQKKEVMKGLAAGVIFLLALTALIAVADLALTLWA